MVLRLLLVLFIRCKGFYRWFWVWSWDRIWVEFLVVGLEISKMCFRWCCRGWVFLCCVCWDGIWFDGMVMGWWGRNIGCDYWWFFWYVVRWDVVKGCGYFCIRWFIGYVR